jgi:transposase-like protein
LSTVSTRRLTPTDWATIVTLYERGEKNTRELSEQFGVTPQAIYQGLKSRGIVKGSRLEEVMTEIDDTARKERERKVKQANIAVEQYAKYNDAIVKLTMKKVVDASANNGAIANVNPDIITLKNAIAIVAKARKENWDILQIEELLGENAELPDLNVGEYTPEELDRIRQANEEGYLQSIDADEFGDIEDIDDIDEGDEPEED